MIKEDKEMWGKFNTGELNRENFQQHHMVSIEYAKTKSHDLWKLSGLDPDDGINKLLLPKKDNGYESRSKHNGGHADAHRGRIIKIIDDIRDKGIAEGWNKNQYREAFQKALIEERKGLISGEIDLYMKKK